VLTLLGLALLLAFGRQRVPEAQGRAVASAA